MRKSFFALIRRIMCISIIVTAACCTNQGRSKAQAEAGKEEAVADTTDEAIPFMFVDEQPLFNGLPADNFAGWVNLQLKYPESLKEKRVEGKVLLGFVIDKAGKMTEVKVIEGVCEELDNEAVRAVSLSPDWTPGMDDGRLVRVSYKFPIIFKFNDSEQHPTL